MAAAPISKGVSRHVVAWLFLLIGAMWGCEIGLEARSRLGLRTKASDRRSVETQVDQGVARGTFSAGADHAQVLSASEDSAVAGTTLVVPPGVLGVDTTITVAHGGALASDAALPVELGLPDVGVTAAAPAVLVNPDQEASASAPFTLAIPMPSGASLTTQGAEVSKLLAVVYKVYVPATKSIVMGLLPYNVLRQVGALIEFDIQYFGVFQAVMTAVPVASALEQPAADQTIRDAAGNAVVAAPAATQPSPPSPSSPQTGNAPASVVELTSPAADTVVSRAQRTAFVVSGTCSHNGRQVVVSAPVAATAACASGAWSATLDVSSLADGKFVVAAGHAPEGGVKGQGATRSFILDATPPLVPVVAALGPTNVTTPTWTWSSGGGGSGAYRFKLGNADLTTGATATSSPTFTPASALAEGTHTLYVQEKDAAGNWSAVASGVRVVDTTPPNGAFAINSGAAFTTAGSVTLDLASSTGIEDYRAANGADCSSATWAKLTSGSMAHTLAGGDGVKTVCLQVRDVAGNAASVTTDTITLDQTAPVPTIGSTEAPVSTAAVLPITVNFSEAVVGFTAGDVGLANGTLSNFSGSGASYTFDVTPSGGSVTVMVAIAAAVATDAAGNQNAAASSLSIVVDLSAPVPGASGNITVSKLGVHGLKLQWAAATDASAVTYKVCRSASYNLGSVGTAEANCTDVSGGYIGGTSVTASGLSAGTTWYFNIIAKDAVGNKAIYNTTASITTARAHLAFTRNPSSTSMSLRHALWQSGAWAVSSDLATSPTVMPVALAVDSSRKAHIAHANSSYLDYITDASGSWSSPNAAISGVFNMDNVTITLDGSANSTIVGRRQDVSRFFVGSTSNGGVSFAQLDSGVSNYSHVTAARDPVSGDVQACATLGSPPRISCFNVNDWVEDVVHAPGSGTVGNPALAIDGSGKRHVAFYRSSDTSLIYATDASGSWVTTVVEAGGKMPKLVLDTVTGYPRIVHFDSNTNDLRYAAYDGATWASESLVTVPAGNLSARRNTDIAVDAVGEIHVAYAATSKKIYYIHGGIGSWSSPELVYNGGSDPGSLYAGYDLDLEVE